MAHGQLDGKTNRRLIELYRLQKADSSKKADSSFIVMANDPDGFLSARRGQIIKRLSWNLFVVRGNLHDREGEFAVEGGAGPLWKLSDNLVETLAARPPRKVLVQLISRDAVLANDLSKYGEVIMRDQNQIVLRTEARHIQELAGDGRIEFIDLVRSAKEEIAVGGLDLSSDGVTVVHRRYPALNGEKIKVSLKENRFDSNDPDLLLKTFQTGLEASEVSPHATTMATIVGGMGNSFITGLGVAPRVLLGSSSFRNLYPDNFEYFKVSGTFLQNHSYGVGVENYYGGEAAQYDRQVFENDSLVHVFSSGNEGAASPVTGIYRNLNGWANLTGNFKQAKNVLVVGATDLDNNVPALSSKGPAFDGRVKPDLVANGVAGTSGAAAIATGTVALLQQAYFMENGRYPSSALVKALLMCGAKKIGPDEIDYIHGYGKLSGISSVEALQKKQFFMSDVSPGEEYTQPISLPAGISGLTVSLAWTDPPASPNVALALVNDLDLEVRDESGNVFQPWVLNGHPSPDSLRKPPHRGRDSLNNAEKLTVSSPMAGRYFISVRGRKVVSGRQKFAVAYRYEESNEFKFTRPLLNDEFISSQSTYIRWETTMSGERGLLSVSYDNGTSWIFVSPVELSLDYKLWLCPNIFSLALLKMQIGDREFISQPFSISSPLGLRVGFNCERDVSLNWTKQAGSVAYRVYNLDGDSLRLLAETSDTTVVFDKGQVSSNIFSVRAIGRNFNGVISYATDVTLQGVGCYIRTFVADATNEQKVRLSLNVGTSNGLESITWQRKGPNGFVDIGNTYGSESLSTYNFTDERPSFGIQFYRALLKRKNGDKVTSVVVSAILLRPDQFEVYPNPVKSDLNILNGTGQYFDFRLYDLLGREVKSERLYGKLATTSLLNITSGVYVVVIISSNGGKHNSKLIKQ